MGFGLVTFRVVVMIGMDIAGECGWWGSCLVVGLRLLVVLVLVYKLWLCVFGFVGVRFCIGVWWWYVGGCLAWMAGSVWLFVWWFAELGWCSVWFCFGFGFVCGVLWFRFSLLFWWWV